MTSSNSSALARTGRERQRYDNNFRLVSGCIPFKLIKDNVYQNHDPESRIRVLMISTPNRDDLVFPKGGWEDDETVEEAACREALEEAGVKGILIVRFVFRFYLKCSVQNKPLGDWEFRSKSKQEACILEGGCRGRMFALEVTEELESWPEQETYSRKWLSIKDAYRVCRYEWMQMALDEFRRVMAEFTRHEIIESDIDIMDESQNTFSYCNVNPSTTPNASVRVLEFHLLDLVEILDP